MSTEPVWWKFCVQGLEVGKAPTKLSPTLVATKSYLDKGMEEDTVSSEEDLQPPAAQTKSTAPSYYISGVFLAIGTFVSTSMMGITDNEDEKGPDGSNSLSLLLLVFWVKSLDEAKGSCAVPAGILPFTKYSSNISVFNVSVIASLSLK